MRRLLLLVCGARRGRHDALRGAHAAPPPLRARPPPLEGGSRRARRRVRGRRARRRTAGRRSPPRDSALGAPSRRPGADGTRRASRFAFVHGFWPLAAARFLQGCGSAFTWAGAFAWLLAAAPRERRGEVIGTAHGRRRLRRALRSGRRSSGRAAGTRTSSSRALAGLAVVLAVWTLRSSPIPPEHALAGSDASARSATPCFVGGLALDGAAVVPLRRPLHSGAAPARRLRLGSGWPSARSGSSAPRSRPFSRRSSADARPPRRLASRSKSRSQPASRSRSASRSGLRPLLYVPL